MSLYNNFLYFSYSENRVEFLEKLQRVCAQVAGGAQSLPILSTSGPSRLVVGNWSLICQREGEVAIHNSDGNRVSIHERERERERQREIVGIILFLCHASNPPSSAKVFKASSLSQTEGRGST